MLVPWYIPFTKVFLLNTCIIYTFFKILNKNKRNPKSVIVLILFNIIMAAFYATIKNYIEKPFIYLIYYGVFSFNFSAIMNNNFWKGIILTAISIAISLISMLISTVISFIVYKIISIELTNETMIEYLTVGIIQFLLIYLFFKIKRFKYGFSFLRESENINEKNINKLGIIVSFVIITISLVLSIYSRTTSKILVAILIIGGILMIYWIKKSITKYYKEKMKERTVEIQQEQIKEKDETIKNLELELANVLQINHKYNHRLSAMEQAVTKLGNKLKANEEFAEEYADILSSLNELSKEYKEEVASISKENELPKTNIFSIDNLLEYMKLEAEKSKIGFELKVNFDINEIIENKISKNRLETLLADHIKDAIIAINSSENKERKIKVSFDKDKDYQIKFYDTGIEFEIETLLNLGLERITTHKMSGGTGIGFMTTFETLKECKASLIIEEYNKQEYTKAVIIKFDDKSEYRIHSYRAEEIKNKTQNNRIIIY
ncbi:MAG: hypothetical protein ACI4UX_02330 [Clostridia bacterium]